MFGFAPDADVPQSLLCHQPAMTFHVDFWGLELWGVLSFAGLRATSDSDGVTPEVLNSVSQQVSVV